MLQTLKPKKTYFHIQERNVRSVFYHKYKLMILGFMASLFSHFSGLYDLEEADLLSVCWLKWK